jgi:hypothetical protein
MRGRLMLAKFILFLGLTISLIAPLPASAATNLFGGVDCNRTGSNNSTVCKTGSSTESPLTGPNGVLVKAANLMALIAGAVAVIFLILGGLKYVSSNGAPDQISRAKESIIYALVGLIVIGLARAIIGFVLNKF